MIKYLKVLMKINDSKSKWFSPLRLIFIYKEKLKVEISGIKLFFWYIFWNGNPWESGFQIYHVITLNNMLLRCPIITNGKNKSPLTQKRRTCVYPLRFNQRIDSFDLCKSTRKIRQIDILHWRFFFAAS